MAGPRRCVVTGGAGFIGSHLVERLLGDGHRVSVVDDFSTGRMANLNPSEGSPKLEIHECDVAESAGLEPIMDGAEWVFHLAALADIVPSIQRPLDYHRANVDGTVAVLEAARAAGATRFVYAASSSLCDSSTCTGRERGHPVPTGRCSASSSPRSSLGGPSRSLVTGSRHATSRMSRMLRPPARSQPNRMPAAGSTTSAPATRPASTGSRPSSATKRVSFTYLDVRGSLT